MNLGYKIKEQEYLHYIINVHTSLTFTALLL